MRKLSLLYLDHTIAFVLITLTLLNSQMGGVSSKWKKIRKHPSKADIGASNVTSPPTRSFSLFDLNKPQKPSGSEAKSGNGKDSISRHSNLLTVVD